MKKRTLLLWAGGAVALISAGLFAPLPDPVLDAMTPISPASAQLSQCPNTNPGFTAGGNVFGRLSSQWNQYFAAKVDAVNGVLCNPTVIGGSLAANIPDARFMGNASGGTAPAVPLPVDPPLLISGGKMTWAGSCSSLSDDGTACTANVGTSGATLGLLNANKTDSGNNTYSGTNTHSGLEKFSNVYGTNRTVVDPATTDTLTAADCGKSIVYKNTSSLTVSTFVTTLAATEACAIAIVQKGAGAVNIAAGVGTTVNSPISCTKVFGQYGLASLYVAGDAPAEWLLGGNCLP